MDVTTIQNLYRETWGDLRQAFRVLTPEWGILQRLDNYDQLSLRAMNWPTMLVNSGGVALTQDGGSLARATSPSPQEATDEWKHLVGRIEVGFDALKAEDSSRFGPAQIEKQLRFQIGQKVAAFRRTLAIYFYGHADAVLFHVATVNDGADTITVDNLYGETGLAIGTLSDYITTEDVLAIHDASTELEHVRAEVVDITDSSATIEFTAGTDLSSVADGDFVVLANTVITNEGSSLDLGINGLLDIFRATAIHNISSATFPNWAPTVDETSYGQALDGTDLFSWFDQIKKRSPFGNAPAWGWTTTGVIAAAGGAELDQTRYRPEDRRKILGFDGVDAMGVMLESMPFTPSGFLFLGTDEALKKLSPDESTADEIASVIDSGDVQAVSRPFQEYEDRLGFYTDLIMRAQLTVVARAGLGIVSGITEA